MFIYSYGPKKTGRSAGVPPAIRRLGTLFEMRLPFHWTVQGLFILSSFPPLVIPAQAGIYIVLPRESCHRPL